MKRPHPHLVAEMLEHARPQHPEEDARQLMERVYYRIDALHPSPKSPWPYVAAGLGVALAAAVFELRHCL